MEMEMGLVMCLVPCAFCICISVSYTAFCHSYLAAYPAFSVFIRNMHLR